MKTLVDLVDLVLFVGAFETALREREQALALYGLQQRDKSGDGDKDVSSGNGGGREHDAPSAGSGTSPLPFFIYSFIYSNIYLFQCLFVKL